MSTNLRNMVVPLGLAVLLYMAYSSLGWKGVLAVTGGILMWLLLHITRLMAIMRRAANTPMGYVASAVMLNAKLKPNAALVHVIALTRSLGLRQSEEGQEPEIYRWTDGTDSYVTCEFVGGRLKQWTLQRPQESLSKSHSTQPKAVPAP